MNALEKCIEGIKSVWGPISSELVADCKSQLEKLMKASITEEWLASLHLEAPAHKELYRDSTDGFILLAHTEPENLYRPPHDHGDGWVIYAIQNGEIEIATYARIQSPDGSVKLVKRDTTLVRPGQAQIYLPGDIHDARCTSGPALYFRFTERDLKLEAKANKLTRYIWKNNDWTTPTEQ